MIGSTLDRAVTHIAFERLAMAGDSKDAADMKQCAIDDLRQG